MLMNIRLGLALLILCLSFSEVFCQNTLLQRDTIKTKDPVKGYSHQLGIEFRPASVLASPPFYAGHDDEQTIPKKLFSGHLRYSFELPSGTLGSQVFPNTQQGVGVAYFVFNGSKQYGSPIATYLFQNAEIAHMCKRVSLGYEWNFGLSTAWKPYDPLTNPENLTVGSRENAYINIGMFVRWWLTDRLALTSGVDLTHFSNGNTEYPNSGVNAVGAKIGIQYDVSKQLEKDNPLRSQVAVYKFPRHISYDLVAFASWRRKGVYAFGSQVASPHKYPVIGAYFAPMYNTGYRFRTGLSLDAIYDGSANVYTEDYIIGTEQKFYKPNLDRQIALGISARAEYIMPIFTIGVGLGKNVLYKGDDFNGTYQSFALKIGTSRSSFLHIGYNLKDFHEPNYLMLGLGYRFNNKTPSLLAP